MISLNRPLGLVLAGGGALGAWQAGCLTRLAEYGLEFERVLGFSIGALNGAAYWSGKTELMARLWRDVSRHRILRPSLRLRPLSFCSSRPLQDMLAVIAVSGAPRGRSRLTVVSLCLDDLKPWYARFGPNSEWGEELRTHLIASCALPPVFAPVRLELEGKTRTLIDGGVPGKEPLSFADLADCADVLVLEMMREDEIGRNRIWPYSLEQASREGVYRSITQAVNALKRRSSPPRVFRLQPSRMLDFTMLNFSSKYCAPAYDLGLVDAERFLKDPEKEVDFQA